MAERKKQIDWERVAGPAVFWLWNATPERLDIVRGIQAFETNGFNTVYVHAMPQSFRPEDFYEGMEVEYLSDAYFELIIETCEQLRRRGMSMWLYDEGGWPSGTACGAVVAAESNFGVWTLTPDGPRQHLSRLDYPDLMNPQATATFIELAHERYRTAVGKEFGKTVLGMFTDEPRLLGCVGTPEVPWSPRLPTAYKRMHGRLLERDLPAIFKPGNHKAHRRYIQAVSTLVTQAYYKPIRQWCEKYGLLFSGHHSGEHTYSRHGRCFGDYLQQAQQYHVPGVDAIWRQIFPGRSANYVSLASSSAWLNAKPCALTESYSVYGAGLTLQQMKWIAAYQLVRGVNHIAVMPSVLSTQGARRIGAGQDFSPREPRWLDIDLLTDFVSKVAKFTLSGKPRPTVAVLYRGELVDDRQAKTFDREHEELCDRIGDGLCAFAFVDAGKLKRLRDLQAVAHHVDAPLNVEERKAMRASGLKVIDAKTSTDYSKFSLLSNVSSVRGVRVLPLTNGGLLLFNQRARPVRLSFDWPKPLREVVVDDPLSRNIYPLMRDEQRVTVRLGPYEMRAFERGRENCRSWRPAGSQIIETDWTVIEVERFVIEDEVRIHRLDDEARPTVLGDYVASRPDFSGSLEYETTLQIAHRDDERLVIDLGKVYEAAELFVNGESVGRRAWGPYRFDVTDEWRDGENNVVVRVTNTLAPQWLRDDVMKRDFEQWPNAYLTMVHRYLPQSKRGGLIGPVRLRRYRS